MVFKRILCVFLILSLFPIYSTGAEESVHMYSEASVPDNVILIPVEADTYVQQGTPTQNFGKRAYVLSLAASSVSREAYLRFDLGSALAGDFVISKAELCITAFQGTMNSAGANQNFTIYRVDEDDWVEGDGDGTVVAQGITWNNSRDFTFTEILTTTARPTYNTQYYVDITDVVRDELLIDNKLSLKLASAYRGSNTWGIQFHSKEADVTDAFKPHLRLTVVTDPDEITVLNDLNAIDLGDLSAVTSDLELPETGQSGETTIIWSSDSPYIDASGKVTRPSWAEGDKTVKLTATVIKNSAMMSAEFIATVLREELTDATIVELDSIPVMALDNITTIKNLDFPTEGLYGSVISYESDMPEVLSNEGIVVRPGPEGQSASVTVRVTVSYGTAISTFDLHIFVPKEQSYNTESMRQSLRDVYGYVTEKIEGSVEGNAPGQHPVGSKSEALSKASTVYDMYGESGSYIELKEAIKSLSTILKDFLGTAKTSDVVIDEKEYALEFSEYRVTLMQDVAAAEIALMTEPDMYTVSAKVALSDYIDYAKSVLDGTYVRPFTRNREFIKPRPDELIQFAIKANSKTYPGLDEGTEMGMAHMTRWYASQHMLSGTTLLLTLSPSDDTYIRWGSSDVNGTNYGSEPTVLSGNSRLAFIRFDLSQIEGNIQKAVIKLTNASSNRADMMLRYIPDERDNWDENTITYNKWLQQNNGELWLGDITHEFKPAGLNGEIALDVTENAQEEKRKHDGRLSFQIDRVAYQYPISFYSKENNTPDGKDRQIKMELETDVPDKARIDAKYNDIINKAETMLAKAKIGSGVGEYPASAVENVRVAKQIAQDMYEAGDVLVLAKSLVKLYDAMREMRHQQVLRSDIEPLSNLFFTEEEAIRFSTKINKYSVLKNEYNYLKQLSDQSSMQDIDRLFWIMYENVPRETINQYFTLYSSSENITFTPPANTAYGRLEIYLPNTNYEDKENNRLGHIWIDNVNISVAGEDDIPVENYSFDLGTGSMPDYWEPVAYFGNPVFKWETRPRYVSDGSASFYIENPTSADQGGVRYTEKLPLVPSVAHTMTFRTKIDGKFVDRGIIAKITFYDKDNNEISFFEKESNRKSSKGNVLNEAQADAIVYAVEKDIYYAQKAKKRLLYSINDFCQGAESWLVYNARPDNIDAYGQVQGGRIMASICATYTLIKDANVFTPEEFEQFTRALEYLAYFIMDVRDRTEDDFERATQGTNWQTDMACGAGLYGITFPFMKHARTFMTNGALVLKGHMENQLSDDGAWPESTRYLGSVINKFSNFARAIDVAVGENWYVGTKLAKTYEHLINIHTPPYIYFNNTISTPPVGDHVLSGQNVFAPLGIYYDQVAKINPKLAVWMYETWRKAGSPMASYGNESISLQNFFGSMEPPSGGNYPIRLGDYSSENVGHYIFRENYGRDNEKFFCVISNNTVLGHNHYDQGTFIYYANSLPLVMDPGVENYFQSSKKYYTNSYSHSALLFMKNGAYINTPTTSVEDNIFRSDELDTIRVSIDYGTNGQHKRNIALLENGFSAVIIWDQVSGASENTVFNMPVIAKSSSVQGNVVTSVGHYGTNLQTTILEPKTAEITTEWGAATEFMPKVAGDYKQNYIKSTAKKNENHLVVLQPLKVGQKGLYISELPTNVPFVTAYKLQKPNGGYAVVITNDNLTAKTVTLDCDKNLVDMKTDTVYQSTQGKATITVEANQMLILKSSDVQKPVKQSVEIKGFATVEIPTSGENRSNYNADVISQYNNTILGEQVTWSLKQNVPGVSIDQNGVLRVSKTAAPFTTVGIVASSGNVSAVKHVTLVPSESKRTSIEIIGPESVALPENDDSVSVVFTARVFDQFGTQVPDDLEWELSRVIDGAYIKDGILTISKTVPEGTVITIIAKSKGSISVIDSKSVKVEASTGTDIIIEGATYVSPPKTGTRTLTYTAKVVDQNDRVRAGEAVEFSLVEEMQGVLIDNNVLSIDSSVLSGSEIKIRATSVENPALIKVFSVFVEDNIPESVEISGEASLEVPKTGYTQIKYSAVVRSYDNSVLPHGVVYSMDKSVPGVMLDKNTGIMTIYRTAQTAQLRVIATVAGFEQISSYINVKLQNNNITTGGAGSGGGAGGGGGGGVNGGGIPNLSPQPPVSEEVSHDFKDVPKSHWSYEIVHALKDMKIINGDQNNNFNPEADVTRAEFVKMLVAVLGSEQVQRNVSFYDVPEDAWYCDAVETAAAMGLVNGNENGCFEPNRPITREEIASILYRSLAHIQYESVEEDAPEFDDFDSISDFARDAVRLIRSLGIIKGFEDNTFAPKKNATRAESAAFIFRFMHIER